MKTPGYLSIRSYIYLLLAIILSIFLITTSYLLLSNARIKKTNDMAHHYHFKTAFHCSIIKIEIISLIHLIEHPKAVFFSMGRIIKKQDKMVDPKNPAPGSIYLIENNFTKIEALQRKFKIAEYENALKRARAQYDRLNKVYDQLDEPGGQTFEALKNRATSLFISISQMEKLHRSAFSDMEAGLVEEKKNQARDIVVLLGLMFIVGALLIWKILSWINGSIKEQIKTAKVIRESEKKYRTLIEDSRDAIFITSVDGTIIDMNQAALDIFGYSKKEMLKLNTLALYSDPDGREKFRAKIEKEGSARNFEVKMLRKNGSEIDCLITASHRKSDDGQVVGYHGTIRDITAVKKAEKERKYLEERIRQAQKLESLGVLAGGIAHDFNNLLTSILGNADLALDELSEASPAYETVKDIETATKRAADFCRQMLAYSGKGKFVIKVININEVVLEMAHLLEVSCSKKAALKYDLDDSISLIEADVTQLRQVIMNLITNASEAIGEENGVISITTGCVECDSSYLAEIEMAETLPEGRYVFLEVSDTGVGMDKKTMSKIFDPFFTTKFTGRGLGMSAVLGIMRGHKGAIKVYSEPGKGTVFKVFFPESSKSVSEEIRSADKTAENAQWSGTVLIADDEEEVLNVSRKMMKKLSFDVLTVTDGVEALEVFEERVDEIDFVFLDLTMPRMGGEECFRKLRKINKEIPIIMISGYNEQDVTQKFIGRGLTGFIQKPFQMAEIKQAIRQILK